ncbi:ATP-binding protein [Bdellovibrio bacteriovorus]|uniref:ATP-binding protein n=1 Tax=Bdellovibrio bacteriovorus TaxID=959 RepID=UPI0035A5F517
MKLLEYNDSDALGHVKSVDTSSVIVHIANIELLRKMQVNRLVVLQSAKAGHNLIGVVTKITRTSGGHQHEVEFEDSTQLIEETNTVRISLIGTLIDQVGSKKNVFRRTLETVPEIDSRCFSMEGDKLTGFMRTISHLTGEEKNKLSLGKYTLDESAEAFLSGNKFFQRHAVIVGSTGSGKSWTTAKLIEQVSGLDNANAILFDIHGEYKTLQAPGIRHLKIAGPEEVKLSRSLEQGVIHLPAWLLTYEKLITMLVDRSDQNAPNQSMLLARTILECKTKYLESIGKKDILNNFTVDSPIPFDISKVLETLNDVNTEMVDGARGQKQGEFYGKLGRLIQRLENKISDRRLGFMFSKDKNLMEYDWLHKLISMLMSGSSRQNDRTGGVKIIDLSEVPSDILPLTVSLMSELIFSVQQWTISSKRHPIAIFCDEAHLYIPEQYSGGTSAEASLNSFERIAKEGRKYGVSLVIISQRPSEVNKTVLSQCNNFIAMRLMNSDDQSVIKRLLPDSLGGFGDLLPILDVGEALVVGDASLLPSRIRISEPSTRPDSGTIDFWDRWALTEYQADLTQSVEFLRKQSKA